MKNLLSVVIFFSLSTFGRLSAQDITVEMQKFPFSDVAEWSEHGLILFAKDPAKNTLQQELSYVNQKGELIWQEHYLPSVENPSMISSGESDYMYFLDQIRPDAEGKIYFNQVSISGYVKKGSIFFPPLFRALENVDFTNSKLINIINSNSDLIFHFREMDKKNNMYKDVLIFFNHTMLKAYPVLAPGVYLFSEIENNSKSLLQYVGSKRGDNYFANYTTKNKQKGYDLITYSEKGELKATPFMNAPKEKVTSIKLASNQLNGAYYLNEDQPAVLGQLLYYKDAFYLAGGNETGGVSVWKYTDGNPTLLVKDLAVAHKKSTEYALGVSFLDNRFIVFAKSDQTTQSSVFDLSGKSLTTGGDYEKEYERNPSQLFFTKKPLNFVIKLGDAIYEINKQNWSATDKSAIFKRQ
ncbi:MAG: hypothetical protein ABI207_00750 [Crocinitomicaceae bacterium]